MFQLPKVWTQQTVLQKCVDCGQIGHEERECKHEVKCANCEGEHLAYTRNRPKWKIEQIRTWYVIPYQFLVIFDVENIFFLHDAQDISHE